jgi:hypothetical protein
MDAAKPNPITPTMVVATITALVGLIATQGFIEDNVAQTVTGGAAILVPFGWLVYDAIRRQARARVIAAAINAEAAVTQFQAAHVMADEARRGAMPGAARGQTGTDSNLASRTLERHKRLIAQV